MSQAQARSVCRSRGSAATVPAAAGGSPECHSGGRESTRTVRVSLRSDRLESEAPEKSWHAAPAAASIDRHGHRDGDCESQAVTVRSSRARTRLKFPAVRPLPAY
eukprot:757269-Hanusia_phi.AAC.14